MTLLDAIAQADGLRPNTIPADVKAQWVEEIEEIYAEMMGVETENGFPNNKELLLPRGHVWHVCAMIDLANKDFEFYNVDKAKAEDEIKEERAKWRRVNPARRTVWRV